MLEIAELPVVDAHCHPFLNPGELSVEAFVDLVALGGGSQRFTEEGGVAFTSAVRAELQRVKRDTVYFRRLVRDLAAFFGVEPELEQVLERRNAAVRAGYRGYVGRLFRDAGIVTLIADMGFPQPPVDLATFRREVPAGVVPIFRIEPLIAGLLAEDLSWPEFRRRFDESIANALQRDGYRGLKSVIAYRTGLDVSPLSRSPDQGLMAYDGVKRGLGGDAMKRLRDHLLCRALELCIEYDVPMQIHTGVGDVEINLPYCRPAYLMELLRFPAFRACRVVLTHAGYPYHREAAYMAHVLPRVYCDVSEGIPFAGHAAPALIREVLEMAPLSKVVYGSDGFALPELNYTAAKLAKQALGLALGQLVEEGMLSKTEAEEAAWLILAGTARRLYRLD